MANGDQAGGDPPDPGTMRFQDGSTVPRRPTLDELHARDQAIRRQQEEQRAAAEDGARSRRKRRRILVGAGVTVGIVAVIAVGYWIAQPDEEVVAQCVDEESGVIVDDSNCVTPSSDDGSYRSGGLYPIFIGGGGRQYRYNYGGSGSPGQSVSGGTSVVPKEGTRVTTSSGKSLSGSSSSVSRGGLGVSNSGSSSGS